jgi:hypothetical protein
MKTSLPMTPIRGVSTIRRPNPKQALNSVLRCKTHEEAEARMTELLARAWSAGTEAGWREGASDANDDEPIRISNPYYAPRGHA